MSSPTPTFAGLPSHVLEAIGGNCDEKELWRLRRTCRAIHSAAEVALRPYLAFKRIAPNPPLLKNIFDPIDERFASHDHPDQIGTRMDNISKAEDGFHHHLKAYPPSSDHLRYLSIELEEYSSGRTSGWKVLERFADQLEELEVHYWAGIWPVAVVDDYYEDEDLLLNTDGIVFPSLLLRPHITHFKNLTRLTIVATAQILVVAANFLPCAPGLLDVTLSCHFRPEDEFYNDTSQYFEHAMNRMDVPHPADSLPVLKRLTIASDDRTTSEIIGVLHHYAQNLTYITIDISKSRVDRGMRRVIQVLSDCQSLRGLAIYGPYVPKALRCWVGMQDEAALLSAWAFSELETLVIQGEDLDRQYGLELLNSIQDARPALPSLKRISWMDDEESVPFEVFSARPAVTCTPGYRSRTSAYSEYAQEQKPELDELFHFYPKLKEVDWIARYPSDPFGDGLSSFGRIVHHSVQRPNDASQIVEET